MASPTDEVGGKRARHDDTPGLQARSSTTEVAPLKNAQVEVDVPEEDMLPTDPAQLRTMVLALRQHVVAYQKQLQDVQHQLATLIDSHDTVLKENKRLKDGAAKVSERSTALLDELKVQAEHTLAKKERLQQWEAELSRKEELLRAVEGISTTQQPPMQRTASQPPSADHMTERIMSLLENVQHLTNASAAPATSTPSSNPLLASTISSNTLRRDSSTISVGRRSGSSADVFWQQLMSLGAAPPESDSTMPTSGSKEVAARLAMMIKPCQGSAQPVAQNQQPQTSPPTRMEEGLASIRFPQPAWLKGSASHGGQPKLGSSAADAGMLQALANLPPEQVQALLASDAGAALALMTAKMQRGGGSA